MIRDEAEYRSACVRLDGALSRLARHRIRLQEAGLSEEEIKRVLDPVESLHLQLKEEIDHYQRMK